MSEKKHGTPQETAAEREKKILQFWKENAIFEKSEGRVPKGFFGTIMEFLRKKKEFIFLTDRHLRQDCRISEVF